MQFRQWIKAAEGQGWRLVQVSAYLVTLQCAAMGCGCCIGVPVDTLGTVPEPCGKVHRSGYGSATFEGYEAFIDDLRRRRLQLGLSLEDLDAVIGWATGYGAKLESRARIASPPTLILWAQSLGLILSTSPAPLPAATIAAISNRRVQPYAATQARFKERSPSLWGGGAAPLPVSG